MVVGTLCCQWLGRWLFIGPRNFHQDASSVVSLWPWGQAFHPVGGFGELGQASRAWARAPEGAFEVLDTPPQRQPGDQGKPFPTPPCA